MTVPDEAVEAAAKVLAVQAWGEWEYVPTELRRRFIRDAQTIIDTAAPFIAAKAWDEGFKQGGPMHDVNMDNPDAHTRNPYRSHA